MNNIPTEIEKDIKSGKARYKTYQTGMGGQSVLLVPPNSYIVIFGYQFSPAGGGLQFFTNTASTDVILSPPEAQPFETQQVSFFTGQDFHNFVHHVDLRNAGRAIARYLDIDNSPQYQSTYMIASSNVSIAVGLITKVDQETPGVVLANIGVTQNTPLALSYGGDGNRHAIRSYLASATASVFSQPNYSTVDFYDTGTAPDPNPENQFYVPPVLGSATTGIGLIDPSDYIRNQLGDETFVNRYGCNYFLNVQYALYTNQIPEQLG